MKLEGKIALVTGSGRNIGRATVLKLASEGANVVVNARSNRQEVDSVVAEAKEMGVKALGVVADVSDRGQVDNMVSKALAEFGRIDILINTAAIRPHKPFLDVTLADWERVRGIALDGSFYCTQAVMPSMVKNKFGRILFFLGDGSFIGGADRAHISAAKMGLVGLTRALASEFAPHNIRVNAISPGTSNTERRDPGWYAQGHLDHMPGVPMGRKGEADEIASASLFLVSEDSSYITGQTLHVNGGSGYY